MKRILLSALLLASLLGCAHQYRNPITKYAPTTIPEAGTIATVRIGEALVTEANAITIPALIIESDQKIEDYILHKGKYPQFSRSGIYENAAINKAGEKRAKIKITRVTVRDSDKSICIKYSCANVEYSIGSITNYSPNDFQRTLIYNGKSGNRITLGYREFTNDMARPAFSNDVSYDLSESNIIGYKSAKIEVINATNNEITYKIIKGFE